jgi:hypothetical protein
VSDLRKLWLEGPAGRLEALLRVACPARGAAVIAHPHPLHGGTMHNPVVFHTDRALFSAGFTTLRFNFRGVGTSEGTHDEGRGEVEDVAAASAWLRGVARSLPFLSVGYSFGAWCSLRFALAEQSVSGFIGIGLPTRLVGSLPLAELARPATIIQGSADEFGAPAEVERLFAAVRPRAEVIPVANASHLFPERAREVGELVAAAGVQMIAAPPLS